jgi:hypothetical protein
MDSSALLTEVNGPSGETLAEGDSWSITNPAITVLTPPPSPRGNGEPI